VPAGGTLPAAGRVWAGGRVPAKVGADVDEGVRTDVAAGGK
jgi:hypothetical protein